MSHQCDYLFSGDSIGFTQDVMRKLSRFSAEAKSLINTFSRKYRTLPGYLYSSRMLHGKKMKSFFSALLLWTISACSYSGEWIAVDGGVIEFDLRQGEIEQNLWAYLEKQSDFEFLARESYSYQYQAKTETELYINAFCHSFDKQNLHKEFLVVMDGGSCFFQVSFNLENGQFTLLGVNGVA